MVYLVQAERISTSTAAYSIYVGARRKIVRISMRIDNQSFIAYKACIVLICALKTSSQEWLRERLNGSSASKLNGSEGFYREIRAYI